MRSTRTLGSVLLVAFVLLVAVAFNLPVWAQNPELQQRLAEVKQAMAQNKQALAQYTWAEQVTISLKGEQKKREHFQVRVGPDGKQQKTSLDPPANAQPEGGRLKKRIVEKKKEEYKDYADQMKTLAQQYVPPDKDKLRGASVRPSSFPRRRASRGFRPDAGRQPRIRTTL
jgi:hypothetical protein